MIKSESLSKLAPALVKAQKNMGAALKDAKNPFFKSRYADLNAIIDAAIPALNEEGIAVLQSPDVTAEGVSVINTVLLHESGEFIAGQSKVVAAKQNDPQAEGSATTYARRYGLQAMVTLKAEDDDGEAAMGRTAKTETKAKDTVTTKLESKPVVELKVAADNISQAAGSVSPGTTNKGLAGNSFVMESAPEMKAKPAKKGWGANAKKVETKTETADY